MSPSQSFTTHPHFINLTQSDLSLLESMREDDGKWSCERCRRQCGNNIMGLITHLLTSCDKEFETFSSVDAIRLCMALNETHAHEMLGCYTRAARQPRAQKNQEFPATPPGLLSTEEKAEWVFVRARKCHPSSLPPALVTDHALTIMIGAMEIPRVVEATRGPNGNIDPGAALARWNASPHPRSWDDAGNAQQYQSYGALRNRYALHGTCYIFTWPWLIHYQGRW